MHKNLAIIFKELYQYFTKTPLYLLKLRIFTINEILELNDLLLILMKCVFCNFDLPDFNYIKNGFSCPSCNSYYDIMKEDEKQAIYKAHPHFTIKTNKTFEYILVKKA